MRTYRRIAGVVVGLVLVLDLGHPGQPARAADEPEHVPPLVSAPLHAPEQIQSTINGWLTFAASRRPPGGGGGTSGEAPLVGSSGVPQGVSSAVNVVGGGLDSYQGEPAITFSNGRLVGGFNWIYPGACSSATANCAPGATTSTDRGETWTVSRVPIAGNTLGFDPSLSADAAGTIYYAYGVCSGGCGSGNLLVATSSDGTSWTGHVVTPPQGGVFDDKPWVAADPNPARVGRAYIAWDRNQGNNQILYVSRTTNGGQSWSAPVKVNDGNSKFERVIYAMPAVDPNNGTVYVVWMDYARKALFVDKSTNGGTGWGADVKVASLNVTFRDIGCNGGRSMTPAPYIAVDAQGWVYVTYADQKGTTGMDAYLVYSKNGGGTWLGPYRVNVNAAGHQYNPALSVIGSGIIHVSWLDRSDDGANCLTKTYSTVSSGFAANGTPTFSTPVAVTPLASNFDGNPNGPGDYTGIVGYFASGGGTAAMPIYPTHWQVDIVHQTGSAGGFEVYVTPVQP